MAIFWFWFLGSQQLYTIIDEKAKVVDYISRYDGKFYQSLEVYLQSMVNNRHRIERATEEIKLRNNTNVDLFRKYLAAPMVILAILVIYSFIRFYYSSKNWTAVETNLLILLFAAFTTELIFLLVVLEGYQYIPNTDNI